jgi:hypothetical protein
MFYPSFFPNGTDRLAPEVALDAEAALAWMFVMGDRGYFRHIWADLAEGLAHELCSLAFVDYQDWAGVVALLKANEAPLRRFLEIEVLPSDRYEHWEWQQPDWEKVRELLGEESVTLWRERFAANEEDGLRQCRERLEQEAPAPV